MKKWDTDVLKFRNQLAEDGIELTPYEANDFLGQFKIVFDKLACASEERFNKIIDEYRKKLSMVLPIEDIEKTIDLFKRVRYLDL